MSAFKALRGQGTPTGAWVAMSMRAMRRGGLLAGTLGLLLFFSSAQAASAHSQPPPEPNPVLEQVNPGSGCPEAKITLSGKKFGPSGTGKAWFSDFGAVPFGFSEPATISSETSATSMVPIFLVEMNNENSAVYLETTKGKVSNSLPFKLTNLNSCFKGSTGPTGPTGPTGAAGSNGAEGATGATGPEGPAGKEGKEGPAGNEGKEGPAGNEGKAGAEGNEGKAGAEGKEGPAGPTHVASGVVFTPPVGETTILDANSSPGVEVTVKSIDGGEWVLEAKGLGAGCPIPALTDVGGTGFSVGIVSRGCTPGTKIGITVQTSDKDNHEWSFLWVGI